MRVRVAQLMPRCRPQAWVSETRLRSQEMDGRSQLARWRWREGESLLREGTCDRGVFAARRGGALWTRSNALGSAWRLSAGPERGIRTRVHTSALDGDVVAVSARLVLRRVNRLYGRVATRADAEHQRKVSGRCQDSDEPEPEHSMDDRAAVCHAIIVGLGGA